MEFQGFRLLQQRLGMWRLSCFIHVQLFANLQTESHQAPPSLGFSRQEQWLGSPCTPPGDLTNSVMELRSPTLQVDSLPLSHLGSPTKNISSVQFSRSVTSDSLRPRESQHSRPPCPSPTPRAYSCPLSW